MDLTRFHLAEHAPQFEVEMVGTGQGCLERLRETEFDLVLLDYRLPDMDGLNVLKTLVHDGVWAPVVFVTGVDDDTAAIAALELGAADCIVKRDGYLNRLIHSVNRAIAYDRVNRLNEQLRAELAERKRIEEALRESEEQYRTVTESINDAIITIDQNSRIIVFANNAVEKIFGYSTSELLGKELTILMPDRYRDGHRAGVKSYVETGTKHLNWKSTQVLGLHKTGKEIPLEISYGEYAKDKQRYFVGVVRDVTERVRAEEALKLFRTLIDGSNDAIEVLDPETGRFLDVNEKGCLDLGYSREEFLTMTVFDIDPMVDQSSFTRAAEKLRKSGVLLREGIHRRKNGSTFPVEVKVNYIQLDRDYTVTVVRDITERKRLEEQFRQAQKMEAVGQLAGGVAHDFNNLLSVILGYTQMLLENVKESEDSYGMLQDIQRAGERAASVTRQLLTFSRRQPMLPITLDLNLAVRELQKMLERMLGEDIQITTELAPDLWAIRADPTHVEQVVMNLVVNARDAMPEGGALAIRTANAHLNELFEERGPGPNVSPFVRLSVQDFGCGIDESTREHIFEPFFTTKPVGKGTGLGLATVFGIVEQSGGKIHIESTPGKGTTFHLFFPRIEEPVQHIKRIAAPAGGLRGSETVLLVEDEKAVRALASRILKQSGYTVLEADRGESALALAREFDGVIHLLISDVVMPGMRGLDLIDAIRASRAECRVLLMSGYDPERLSYEAITGRNVPFIEKPFRPDDLLHKVREVLTPA